jgi:ribosomal protein L20A (L18A)
MGQYYAEDDWSEDYYSEIGFQDSIDRFFITENLNCKIAIAYVDFDICTYVMWNGNKVVLESKNIKNIDTELGHKEHTFSRILNKFKADRKEYFIKNSKQIEAAKVKKQNIAKLKKQNVNL